MTNLEILKERLAWTCTDLPTPPAWHVFLGSLLMRFVLNTQYLPQTVKYHTTPKVKCLGSSSKWGISYVWDMWKKNVLMKFLVTSEDWGREPLLSSPKLTMMLCKLTLPWMRTNLKNPIENYEDISMLSIFVILLLILLYFSIFNKFYFYSSNFYHLYIVISWIFKIHI